MLRFGGQPAFPQARLPLTNNLLPVTSLLCISFAYTIPAFTASPPALAYLTYPEPEKRRFFEQTNSYGNEHEQKRWLRKPDATQFR